MKTPPTHALPVGVALIEEILKLAEERNASTPEAFDYIRHLRLVLAEQASLADEIPLERHDRSIFLENFKLMDKNLAAAPYYAELRAKRAKSAVARGRVGIVRPPGARIAFVLDFLYSKRTMERVFGPTLADLQSEYFEALDQDRLLKARWIHVRYVWVLASTAIAQLPVSVGRVLLTLWRPTGV